MMLLQLLFLVLSLSIRTEGNEKECNADAGAACVDDSTKLGGIIKDFLDKFQDESCQDEKSSCKEWAEVGECEINAKYMLQSCRRSCKMCNLSEDEVNKLILEQGRQVDEFTESKYGMKQYVPEIAREHYDKMVKYMENTVFVDPFYTPVRKTCKNTHSDCTVWASAGECENNKAYMTTKCAPSCFTCELLDINLRCPLDENAKDALEPGDLDAMFRRIVSDFHPNVYSMPNPTSPDVIVGPWLIGIPNFLSDEECERLVELGHKLGYQTSKQGGKALPDGTRQRITTQYRTSSNTWCETECYDDPLTQQVLNKIVNLTHIPEVNYEHLQLLQYKEGEYYRAHNDLIEVHKQRQQGVRILTLFLYLNDVEEGGGTEFPKLSLVVQPRKGMAVLWPSVLNDKPHEIDMRTDHAALPVIRGEKYGANAWIHQHDFKTPYHSGCYSE